MRLDPRDTMLMVLSYGSLIILIAAMAYVELAGE
jgi:hypothetical protein